jgi:O-phosphoseryl-tRNA synthetase
MELNNGEIKSRAAKDFVSTWLSTAELLPQNTRIELKGPGKSNVLRDLMQKSREILLRLGFDEIENPTILPDADVIKQYGPEARVILDRVFYLAELPRPDIGLDVKRIELIRKISDRIDIEGLRSILRQYKMGEIEADNLIEEMTLRLGITDSQATEIMDKVFPEMKKIKPVSTGNTLRSHMTATWFHTLRSVQRSAMPPVAMFSVGPRYRNEQREDAHHLRVHHSASIVIMDPEMSLEAGREITVKILKEYDFTDARFETKKATSKYYAPGREQEVFAHYKGNWIEVADIGMYSPIALANFDIVWPVFNVGFGIERLAMILYEYDDIRKLVFPQFSTAEFDDEEIAKSLEFIAVPETDRGRKIAQAIEDTAKKYKDKAAPCRFMAWEDDSIRVTLSEKEEGKHLLGPAGFNEICVVDGEIYSSLAPEAIYTGINYMKAISKAAASAIEKSNDNLEFRVRMIKQLSDINLRIPYNVREFIEAKQKKIKVGGPVFLTIEVEHLN